MSNNYNINMHWDVKLEDSSSITINLNSKNGGCKGKNHLAVSSSIRVNNVRALTTVRL